MEAEQNHWSEHPPRFSARHQARNLQDLRVPYGNHLEALKGDRKGQHSLRVNDQWRICFRWQGEDALDVEIVDYH
jgi:toxin HigB-1